MCIFISLIEMAYDNIQKNEPHHHDWLIKKIEDRIAKLMTGDIESSVPIPPKKSLEISHIVSSTGREQITYADVLNACVLPEIKSFPRESKKRCTLRLLKP